MANRVQSLAPSHASSSALASNLHVPSLLRGGVPLNHNSVIWQVPRSSWQKGFGVWHSDVGVSGEREGESERVQGLGPAMSGAQVFREAKRAHSIGTSFPHSLSPCFFVLSPEVALNSTVPQKQANTPAKPEHRPSGLGPNAGF